MDGLIENYDKDSYITVNEAAVILHVHTNTVYNKIRSKQIPCLRVGRAIRIQKKARKRFPSASQMLFHKIDLL